MRDHNADLLLMDLQSIWSRAWVLVAYECLRTAAQRAPGDRTAIDCLRDRFALVRVPLAKSEIAQDKKHLGRRVIELARIGDPPDAPAIEYRAGGDVPYIPQVVWNGETGSTGWVVIDLSTNSHVMILRRQLSDELLALAEAT